MKQIHYSFEIKLLEIWNSYENQNRMSDDFSLEI